VTDLDLALVQAFTGIAAALYYLAAAIAAVAAALLALLIVDLREGIRERSGRS